MTLIDKTHEPKKRQITKNNISSRISKLILNIQRQQNVICEFWTGREEIPYQLGLIMTMVGVTQM